MKKMCTFAVEFIKIIIMILVSEKFNTFQHLQENRHSQKCGLLICKCGSLNTSEMDNVSPQFSFKKHKTL